MSATRRKFIQGIAAMLGTVSITRFGWAPDVPLKPRWTLRFEDHLQVAGFGRCSPASELGRQASLYQDMRTQSVLDDWESLSG